MCCGCDEVMALAAAHSTIVCFVLICIQPEIRGQVVTTLSINATGSSTPTSMQPLTLSTTFSSSTSAWSPTTPVWSTIVNKLNVSVVPQSSLVSNSFDNSMATFTFWPPCPSDKMVIQNADNLAICFGQPCNVQLMFPNVVVSYDNTSQIRVSNLNSLANGNYFGTCLTSDPPVSYAMATVAIAASPRIISIEIQQPNANAIVIPRIGSGSLTGIFLLSSPIVFSSTGQAAIVVSYFVGMSANRTLLSTNLSIPILDGLPFVSRLSNVSSTAVISYQTRNVGWPAGSVVAVGYSFNVTSLVTAGLCSLDGQANLFDIGSAMLVDTASFFVGFSFDMVVAQPTLTRVNATANLSNQYPLLQPPPSVGDCIFALKAAACPSSKDEDVSPIALRFDWTLSNAGWPDSSGQVPTVSGVATGPFFIINGSDCIRLYIQLSSAPVSLQASYLLSCQVTAIGGSWKSVQTPVQSQVPVYSLLASSFNINGNGISSTTSPSGGGGGGGGGGVQASSTSDSGQLEGWVIAVIVACALAFVGIILAIVALVCYCAYENNKRQKAGGGGGGGGYINRYKPTSKLQHENAVAVTPEVAVINVPRSREPLRVSGPAPSTSGEPISILRHSLPPAASSTPYQQDQSLYRSRSVPQRVGYDPNQSRVLLASDF